MVYKEAPRGYKKRIFNYGPYSPSRLITAKCPQRFFGQYIRKDKVIGASVAADRGNAIHQVLEQITLARAQELALTPKQINDWISKAVGEYSAAYQQIDLVSGAVQSYIMNQNPYSNKNTLCEKSFAVQLWEEESFVDDAVSNYCFVEAQYDRKTRGGDFFFGGHIDQLTVDDEIKVVTVLDHKSTPSANENEDHTFQVGAYAWLVSLFYPGYKIRTVLHYAHPALNFYGAPVYWEQEDLAEIQGFITSRVGAIEHMQDFPAVPGTSCDYCHMTQECPVYQKVREQKAKGTLDLNVRTFDDLLRLAKELHVVDTLSSEITKSLKEGINTLCPTSGVDIGGLYYGYKTSEESVDWQATDKKIREESGRAQTRCEENNFSSEDEKSFCEVIKDVQGLDGLLKKFSVVPDNFKKYDNQKLKNLWRLDKPELFQHLSKLIVKDKSTRFGAHKR